MGEKLPLALVHQAVLEFLRDRDDGVVFGAQAVNAYVDETRMTQDVDIVSTRALELAEEIRSYLNERFHIAVGVRNGGEGAEYRIYQIQKPKNRHLVDVRPVSKLPPSRRIESVLVPTPEKLIAHKVTALVRRGAKPKGLSDRLDLLRLLLAFPELKTLEGPVRERLDTAGADQKTLAAWEELVKQEIAAEGDEDKFEV